MERTNTEDKIAAMFLGEGQKEACEAEIESPELSAQQINISQVRERNLDLRNTPLKNVWPEPENILHSNRIVLKKP